MIRRTVLLLLALVPVNASAPAQEPADTRLVRSVEQLRHAIGEWDVTTEFLNEDGSVARAVAGTYRFEWVVPDRVVMGRSSLPDLGQAAGILFYVNEQGGTIEMASVGADGRLWRMTGPLGGEARTTEEFVTQDGGTGQLRFTRFNVQPDSFESRMEHTSDGGKTWQPGNHQVFRRRAVAPGGGTVQDGEGSPPPAAEEQQGTEATSDSRPGSPTRRKQP